jgi:hypothetical protein
MFLKSVRVDDGSNFGLDIGFGAKGRSLNVVRQFLERHRYSLP